MGTIRGSVVPIEFIALTYFAKVSGGKACKQIQQDFSENFLAVK
jgi:hypothetical protein